MGLFDSIMGRRKPVRPDLDAIFGLPSAAITLSASLGFDATGTGAVAFRVPEGRAFAEVQAEIEALLAASGNPAVEVTADQYGYTWLVVSTDPPDVGALVTHLHAVNLTLQDSGFGPQLLCSTVDVRRPGWSAAGDGLPVQAGLVLPVRPARTARRATPSSSCRSATCCATSSRSRRT